MNKIAFVIPYFGHFNNYFQLFLNSCKSNADVDWLIFTDDHRDFDYPPNVIIRYCNFRDIQKLVQSKFDFKVSINRPYKLCDFKVSYGYIFNEFLDGYEFWGYCDSDLIWGKINDFITSEVLSAYDKIGIYGHCTLFRNTEKINTLFMKPLNGIEVYRKIFSEPWNHSFDEEFHESINNIFENYDKKILYDLKLANIYMKSSDFRLTYMNDKREYEVESRKKAFFAWNKGNLFRYEMKGKELHRDKYLYIHMQSRTMKVNVNSEAKAYKIIPNSFDPIEVKCLSADNFERVRRKHPNLHYLRLRSKNLYIKIVRKIKREKV